MQGRTTQISWRAKNLFIFNSRTQNDILLSLQDVFLSTKQGEIRGHSNNNFSGSKYNFNNGKWCENKSSEMWDPHAPLTLMLPITPRYIHNWIEVFFFSDSKLFVQHGHQHRLGPHLPQHTTRSRSRNSRFEVQFHIFGKF